jgi:hypothetical protein
VSVIFVYRSIFILFPSCDGVVLYGGLSYRAE